MGKILPRPERNRSNRLNLNLFDIVFTIILLAFSLFSYLRGALREMLSLLGLAGGFLAATWYAGSLADKLSPFLPSQDASELLSFVLIIVAGYFLGLFLGGFSDYFRRAPESDLSRLLGGLIGFAKGTTISLALFWAVQTYLTTFQDEMTGSIIGGMLAGMLDFLQGTGLI